MARKHLSHIKSKLTENGGPKLPTPSQLIEGEIAVNFAKGYETLSILNSNSGITTFSNDTTIMSYVDGQDMEIANAAGISAVTTSQGLTDYQYVATPNNPILSGATSLKNADELLSQTILDNEVVIAAALNDLDDRKLDASAYTPTDLSNYYNKQEIDTALSDKQDTLSAGTGIDITDNVISCSLEMTTFVSELPLTGEPGKIYFVPNAESEEQGNVFTEYAWTTGNTWEKIGEWKADMTIDQELDSGSTNPVANSAITEALNSMAQEFVIECSGDTLNDSQEGASTLTITNGVTAQDVVDAYNQGKNIVVDAYFVLQDTDPPLNLVANIDSIVVSGNDIIGMGEATVTLIEVIWNSPVDSVRFMVTTEQSQLNVSAAKVLSPLISYDTIHNEASLIMLSEVTDGLGGNFSPKFRYSVGSDSNLSPVVAYLDDLDKLIDDVWVDQEYFATNGANTFATPDKRYNVVDVLELESGVTYDVGSGCTIHFWNDGALSGTSSDTSILGLKDTLITGPMHKLFGDNVVFGGTMRNAECYPEWFGAIGDGETDDADAINRCIYNAGYTPVVLNAMAYYVASSIVMTESGFNTYINTYLGYSETSWGRNQQFIARHNIIGAPTLDGPVLIVESNGSICKVNGAIAVQNTGDSGVGFSSIKTTGPDSGCQDMNIYIHGIHKGPKGDWYESVTTDDTYVSTWGVGHGTGAVLSSYGGYIVIDYIQGFEKGVHLARFYDTQLHVGQCEAIYCVYMGPVYGLPTKGIFVTRNKIFIGSQLRTQENYCKYIVDAEHSSVVREIGDIEIAMNEITVGDSNGAVNRRHPHKHSLYYTAGPAGHTGNKYNFNITYAIESARSFVKYEYASAPTSSNVGIGNGDIINFGVSCYLKDIDIPYGWNVKLNNVLVSNSAASMGSYRWFGTSGIMLIDAVTVSKASTPIWSSAAQTINILNINPQHKGNVIATDTIPATCENNKFYVVDNAQVTITTNGTKKYPVYAKYFGTDATLIGYSLDNYKEPQSLSAGDGIDITNDVISTNGGIVYLDGYVSPDNNTQHDPVSEDNSVNEAFANIVSAMTDNELHTLEVLSGMNESISGISTTLNSKANTSDVYSINQVDGLLAGKQNLLTAGTGIQISGNVISSLATPYVETTYSELKELRDGGELTPGTWYRITDYQCTTKQQDTSAATHQFDILVLATDTDKLSEEARAVNHNGDTYFSGSTLDAWKVWYCLDNDKYRFAWANYDRDVSSPESITIGGVKYDRNLTEDKDGYAHPYAWKNGGVIRYTDTETPTTPSNAYSNYSGGKGTSTFSIDSYSPAHEGTGEEYGRGVIYRLIDEWNNDCPYDFKNIMFQRKITDGSYATGGTNTWCYTLNVWHNNSCNDASVIGNTLINDEGYVTGVYKNKFGTCTEYDVYGDTGYTLKFRLGNNVVLTVDYNNEYYGCHSNTIGNSFYNNTIGNNFYSNTIGNNFDRNTIGNDFRSNTIGSDFANNTIGSDFANNTIGNGFGDNTIGNGFANNTIGNIFGNNTIDGGFYNVIGNRSIGNIIGNGFSANTIGNDFRSNTIGSDFANNTIGNNFYSNAIGNNFYSNAIGNNFDRNTIGTGTGSTATKINYVRYIRVEDGVQFANITTTATTSSSAYLQNITISQGIAGTSSNRKTITHPTVGDTFQTIYRPENSQVISV